MFKQTYLTNVLVVHIYSLYLKSSPAASTGWPKLKYPVIKVRYLDNSIKFYDQVHNITFQLITE